MLSHDQAMDYIDRRRRFSRRIALSVSIINSCNTPADRAHLSEGGRIEEELASIVGILLLFVFTAIGVALIVDGITMERSATAEEGHIILDRETKSKVRELKDTSTGRLLVKIGGGFALVLASL